jgi:hypothetical protein
MVLPALLHTCDLSECGHKLVVVAAPTDNRRSRSCFRASVFFSFLSLIIRDELRAPRRFIESQTDTHQIGD